MTQVIVEADGGSRGNPGLAGYGAVVWDGDHAQVLAERREAIGIATNNVAEYRGLIAGLAAAAELGAREVDVRMDSKLVVEQMSGRWKVKHAGMIPLAERARQLVAGFDRVSFEWIPRERNSHADRLANEAMDDAKVIAEARAETSDRPATQARSSDPTATTAPGWTGARGRPTRFLLLRHGQTELSVQRRYSGRGNPPLTALGHEQAAGAAKYLAAKGDIAAVVTSPLGRARETADAVAQALNAPVRVLDTLIETDFGEWEGLTFLEAAQRDPGLHTRWLGDPGLPAPGGESFAQVRERVEAARRDIVALYPEQNVVVVSHVTPIKTLLQIALGVGPSLLYRLHLDLASLSIAEFYPDGGASVRLVNDTSYL
ncbi:bifunctional RNase H/acid phosphatase [Nocardia blacklockiae]|uniref:bifunctional RNase H/acid phosphatase n=1 Tax=Nocardia blacklockiae TaxID=480036 RepID=UPI0018940972|nr:bifunctional RNase H/acid phosphatase [Nocardia blacklockiae]MBF6175592.1 bifunctional RNase H/acid phosphatase [Nocardia blacklockiae]